MEPTLRDGDLLVVRVPHRDEDLTGRVVVARLPGGRPAGVKRATARQDGGWWLERDSPTQGVDSWTFGAVPTEDVTGVVVARVWPRPCRFTHPSP